MSNINATWIVLDFLNQYANLLLVLVTFAYMVANWMLVTETRHYRLQQVAPYVRVVFQKAPDKVLLENVGIGVAAKAILQSFKFKDTQGAVWHCTFEQVYTILPRDPVPVRCHIEQPETGGLLQDHAIFQIAFAQAAPALSNVPLVLDLYSEDILGNCYKSQVRTHGLDLDMFRQYGKDQRWAPVTLPPAREKQKCPEALPPRSAG